jgi:hypothetical protein
MGSIELAFATLNKIFNYAQRSKLPEVPPVKSTIKREDKRAASSTIMST